MTITLTGDKELRLNLRRLGVQVAPRIARRVALTGASVVANAIRRAAPGRLKRDVGYRLTSSDKNSADAVVGLGVARKATALNISHLVVLGTQPRFRRDLGGRFKFIKNPQKRQLSTGVMPANPFVRRATMQARSAALTAMRRAAAKAIEQAASSGKG